ncbi:hypothetical protein TRFO_18714 [Tritrichomonas foetus]|uniref:Uncharacterized protein n=1 Tax=Tritrichomonas foetus TaxID=1144522 RepID=A0A1J4KKS1_9EUKA|nr:hypothetical protein TRFO_18714 [Tritrichomonas foetus]|eukprot:OHT11738.1 hypothetical protein TRFO_18714 [Tritrichomonas foetus]
MLSYREKGHPVFIVTRTISKPTSKQTDRDRQLTLQRRRKSSIHFKKMEANLQLIFGQKVTKEQLITEAEKISKVKGIKVDRLARRAKEATICWFCENCHEFLNLASNITKETSQYKFDESDKSYRYNNQYNHQSEINYYFNDTKRNIPPRENENSHMNTKAVVGDQKLRPQNNPERKDSNQATFTPKFLLSAGACSFNNDSKDNENSSSFMPLFLNEDQFYDEFIQKENLYNNAVYDIWGF